MTFTHDDLCDIAVNFLKKNGWGVVFSDRFRASTKTGELPDALGFRSGTSIVIECKTSRSDFLADRKKKFRKDPSLGMGSWRFMMAPIGLIKPDELPDNWGLLEVANNGRVKKTVGWPGNSQWISDSPFEANLQSENMYMYSALRRMEIRGHLKEVYEGIPNA